MLNKLFTSIKNIFKAHNKDERNDKMNKVPDIISGKDLDYFADMFNWNFTTSKVAYHFSEEATDEDVKNALHEVATMHAGICRRLVTILGGQNEQ